MANCEFKVGDKVVRVGRDNHDYPNGTVFKKGEVGVVIGIESDGFVDVVANGKKVCGNNPHYLKFVRGEEKIVITHDGKTTTATKYCADGSTVTATARCAPEDEFDFRVGAEIAMGRLVDKLAYAKHNIILVKFREGERTYAYKTRMDTAKVGMKIVVPVGHYGKEVTATVAEIIPGAEYNGEYTISAMKEIDIVKVPQYYNGKVVCINAGNVTKDLTVGRIYTFVDGVSYNEWGSKITTIPIKDCDHLNSRFFSGVKFIPIVE